MNTLIEKINLLKKERNAIILAHNYQLPEVQDIADFTGDSLGLSIQASKTSADVIVFCGVYFMAETAKIVSPQKTVLIPDKNAGCPMAEMITADQLRALRKKYPHSKVLCYVNTPAEVKAEVDFCCTSANAVTVAQHIFKNNEDVIFIPDKYLAHYVTSKIGNTFNTWHGYCPSHIKILPEDIIQRKREHPDAVVLVHPECVPEVIRLADYVVSTEGMCSRVRQSDKEEFIIGTEPGIIHRLKKENPHKLFFPASSLAVCPNMKRITLEKVLRSLETMQHQIELADDIIAKSQKSIKHMMQAIA